MRMNSWIRVGTLVAITGLAACAAEPPPVAAPTGSSVEVRAAVFQERSIIVAAEPTITSVEVLPDRLILTLSGPLSKAVEVGGGVAGGEGREGYIRRILSSSTLPDGRLEIMTMQGDLADAFSRLDITTHYRPIMSGPMGARTTLSDEVGGTSAALSTCEDTTPCEIASGSVDLFGGAGSCSGSVTGGVSLEPYIDTNFEMDADLDIDTDLGWGGISFDVTASVEATGSIGAGVVLTASAAAAGSCDIDIAAALGGGEAPEFKLARIPFSVLGVPVWIDILATPIATGSVNVAIDAGEVTARAGVTIGATASVRYEDGDWSTSFEPTADGELSLTTTRAGGVDANAEVRLGASITTSIYGLGGPMVALTAGLQGTFTADIMCNWNATLTADLQAEFGVSAVSLPVIGEVWEGTTLDPITLASAEIANESGRLAACRMTPTGCTATTPRCTDMVFDADVCAGDQGYQPCVGPVPAGSAYVQRCTCSPSGSWTACSACMTIPAP